MLYEVSNEGRIRTREGKVTSNALRSHRVWKQRILKQKCTRNSKGRRECRVMLWKDGCEKTHLVSRLVAMAFCDGYSDGMTVNHIDGNPLNNRAENLEWCSLKENIQKGFHDGLYNNNLREISLVSPDGSEHRFKSIEDAGRYLGKNGLYISTRIYRNKLNLPNWYIVKTH